ncbi:glycine cleavage system protein GcvH [Enemella evansiae]|uniref:Glycine cleavage system H protein n=1 Tax=Enemella evansiae TaxID=2016499 RepID=A0A255G4X4_9ACTN|nr:glycine cleavage system protein GcvH [Enemella evansiae]PFG67080.1 glycine cleavage system H protein [Propionibacteriaceae bacterium ES.041]OYN98186.1 glycine cleavage system protein H [Enemella evansiae]OYN99346.1 glycine cleavage system protein H [Enemella evansiae]OYO05428.1 glycine cleavage system protein H [Enemella evansiae]OYO10522.1 glycine cleavage system protein H [Enemella evansiae]
MAEFPEDLKYSTEHEWVRPGNGTTVRVGVSEYATEQLGDIVYVQLPDVGQEVSADDSVGELESTKSVSDVMSPVSGVVNQVNEAVVDSPETINSDPYGDGWLFEVEVAGEEAYADLMDADAYAEHVGE